MYKKKKKKITHVFPFSILRFCFNVVKGVIRTQLRRRKTWRQYELFAEQNSSRNFPMNKKDCEFYLEDATGSTGFDRHYIYHPAWAARVLARTKPKRHVDIGSILDFASLVSAFVPFEFYDYRPAQLELDNLKAGAADINKLPFTDNSVESISCMHVLEHIGLGRYGDPIDAEGDLRAIAELKRVTSPGGDMLLVVPVAATPRILFNGHRIYSKQLFIDTVIDENFTLEEFCLIGQDMSDGGLLKEAAEEILSTQYYGCGCFWFKKKS